MKKVLLAGIAILFVVLIFWAYTVVSLSKVGERAFLKHCSTCHAEGGNSIDPSKTLSRKDLNANGIKTSADIMDKIRKPGQGMPPFDRVEISDETAEAIAKYILKTFK